jgi:hypothetical protein
MSVKGAWIAWEVSVDVSLGCTYVYDAARLLGFLRVRSLVCRAGT